MVNWIKKAFTYEEIDVCCKSLPHNHHLRHFFNVITPLSQLTGQEHSDIACILLGLIIDIPVSNVERPFYLVKAVQALLDFLYLAQYPVHSSDSLARMQEALEQFHINKDIFVDMGIHIKSNLPKLHWLKHYV